MASGDKLIAVIDKSTAARIHISTSVYNGKPRIDIREYYLADSGAWMPTKKGISLDEGGFEDLQKALHGLQFDGTYQTVQTHRATEKRADPPVRAETVSKKLSRGDKVAARSNWGERSRVGRIAPM